jgi:hypothetical protein
MEILVTVLLLIVPVFSIVSFVISLRLLSRVKGLKELVLKLAQLLDREENPAKKAVNAFQIGEL